MVVAGTVSPLRQRLASRVNFPSESMRTKMLEIAATRTDVIALGRGDPDLATPAHIIEAAKSALDAGMTHYTHPAGDPRLRRAIARELLATTGNVYDPGTEIIVTLGVQEAVYLALLTLVGRGDEVLVPSHRFTSYDVAIELSEGTVVSYPTVIDGRYRLSSEAIEACLTARSKVLAVVSPDNPTGGVATAEEITAVSQLAKKHDLLVLSDEIYGKFVYDGRRHVSIASMPGMRERTLVMNGFSKCYAMTGWRVGYFAGPADYMRAILEGKHTLTICAPAVSQAAALAALEGPQECIEDMRRIYDRRRHALMKSLTAMGLSFVYPAGAFYIYVDISATRMSAPDFCLRLLQDTGVMIFPGTMFGSEGETYIRISLLAPEAQIEEATDRMKQAVARYTMQG
jgi:aminotransferase